MFLFRVNNWKLLLACLLECSLSFSEREWKTSTLIWGSIITVLRLWNFLALLVGGVVCGFEWEWNSYYLTANTFPRWTEFRYKHLRWLRIQAMRYRSTNLASNWRRRGRSSRKIRKRRLGNGSFSAFSFSSTHKREKERDEDWLARLIPLPFRNPIHFWYQFPLPVEML